MEQNITEAMFIAKEQNESIKVIATMIMISFVAWAGFKSI